MEIKKCIIESFCVIGKDGSTNDGNGFIKKLWDEANSHYNEVESLAKKDGEGNPVGFWGAMSDLLRNFHPWENNFSEGLYLAGVEVDDKAEAPENWTKWMIPSFEYLYVKVESDVPTAFSFVLNYMKEHNLELVGAVHEYFCPEEDGQLYMFFPIRKLVD